MLNAKAAVYVEVDQASEKALGLNMGRKCHTCITVKLL